MFTLTPWLTLLLTLGAPAPDLAPPPPAPVPATRAPAICRIEVRLKDVSEGAAARKPDRLLGRGTLEIHGGKARYRNGERIPIVTYSYKDKGWQAGTTFQDTGVTVQFLEKIDKDGARRVDYECDVACVLDVVGNITPLLGHARWSGTGRLDPGKPIVLTALSRIDGRLRQLPKNHPLRDGKEIAPLPDLVVEIETRIEIVAPAAPPAEKG